MGVPEDEIQFAKEPGRNLDLQLHSRNGKEMKHESLGQISYPETKRSVANRSFYLYNEINIDREYQIQRGSYNPTENSTLSKDDLAFLYIPKKGDKVSIERIIKTRKVFSDIGYEEYNKEIIVTIYKMDGDKILKEYNIDPDIFKKFFMQYSEIESNPGVNLPPEIHNKIADLYEMTDLPKNMKNPFTFTFDHDYYLMMGDNRDYSEDSRIWGLLQDNYIIGSALVIYFPFSRMGSVEQKVNFDSSGMVNY